LQVRGCPPVPYTPLFRSQQTAIAAWRSLPSGFRHGRSRRSILDLPATTQRLEQVHFADQLVAAIIHQLLLGHQQLPLGIEQDQRSEEHTSELQSRQKLVC